MAIVTLDVTGQILHPDLTPASGTVTFQIPIDLNDVVANITYTPAVFTATLDVTGAFTITGLIATDSPDLAESGNWMYRVHVLTDAYAESFSTSLPAAMAPVADFADLIPAQSEPCTDDGSPCASLAQLAALQVEVDALEAQIIEIEAIFVQTVNGLPGPAVVLNAASVGADAAGAASAALTAANIYTDTNAIPRSIVDVKGDLIVATGADVVARLAAGADGLALHTNPATASGLQWRPADPNQLAAGTTVFDRVISGSNTGVALGASQTIRFGFFTAPRAETWTQVAVVTGTTAAGATPTLCRIGIFMVAANGDLTLVASIANDTTLFAAPSTRYVRNLSVALAAVAGQRYAMGVLVVTAAALPTFAGISLNAATAQASLSPRITGQLAGQADLPASILAGVIAASNAAIGGDVLP